MSAHLQTQTHRPPNGHPDGVGTHRPGRPSVCPTTKYRINLPLLKLTTHRTACYVEGPKGGATEYVRRRGLRLVSII